MGILKKIASFSLAAIALAVMFLLQGCPCPKSPDPLVTVLEDGGFSLTPGQVSGADSVFIYTSDADGAPLDTIKIATNASNDYNYDSDVKRPIHLKMGYTNAAGEIVLEDFVSVFDLSGNPGTPIISIDIVMGFTAGNPAPSAQPCTTTTEIATGVGEAIVSWMPNDWFEVHLTLSNGAVEKIGVRMEASSIPGNAGVAKIYRIDSHSCMTNPTCDGANIKAMKVGSGSDLFYISGTDNNDGASPRTLKIKNFSNLGVKVRK